ncbi:MAG: hypothetical protein ACI8UD_002613 [Planctomycetota bacterium]|jgi:hypothetical protein
MPPLSRIFRVVLATAHSTGGWLAYKFGWHGTARRQFERVLLLRGADFRAYVHLGRIAFDHGDYAGWRREFEHARRTDPIRFARLRHPIELFEPRLAGTQYEGSHELDSFQAADSRATWRALHPFGPDPFRSERDGAEDGSRSPDGFGRGTDLPLAPGYDPISPEHMVPGQQLDEGKPGRDVGDDDHLDGPTGGDPLAGDPLAGDPLGQYPLEPQYPHEPQPDAQRDDLGNRRSGQNRTPGWNMPDAALSRDDFATPIERRRFQLRRPIDRQEIARCDLNELARRLSS